MYRTKNKIDKRDGVLKPHLLPAQYCSECGKKVEVLFKGDSNPESWFWVECDHCGEPVCEDCSDIIDDERLCSCCLQDPNINKEK